MKKIISLFIIIISFSCQSQIPGLINYTQEDGLSCSSNYQIKQDNKGFIWIGSSNGLYRFDGREFKQYNKKNGLKNIDVIGCVPLENGEIFITPFLNDFAYLKGEKVINSTLNPELNKIKFGTSPPVINYSKNKLSLCSNSNPKSIYIYENNKISEIPILIDYSKEDLEIAAFKPDSNILCAINQKSFFVAYNVVKKNQKVCIKLMPGEGLIYLKDNVFATVTNNDKIQNVLSVYLLETPYSAKKVQSYQLYKEIHQLIIDKNNKLWVALREGGFLYFDTPLHQNNPLRHPIEFLNDYMIGDILIDRDNNVWFATKNNGIFFISSVAFRNYVNLPIKNNSSYITAIAANGKDIFLGYNSSAGGIYSNGKLRNIVFKKNKIENKAVLAHGNSVFFALVSDLFEYKIHSKMLIGVRDIGSVKNMVSYKQDNILICTSQGLISYNTAKGTKEKL